MAVNAMKLPKPRTTQVRAARLSFSPGHVSVTHHLANGGHQEFNFHDPAKAANHITRVLKREWLHPDKNIGDEINNDLDVNQSGENN